MCVSVCACVCVCVCVAVVSLWLPSPPSKGRDAATLHCRCQSTNGSAPFLSTTEVGRREEERPTEGWGGRWESCGGWVDESGAGAGVGAGNQRCGPAGPNRAPPRPPPGPASGADSDYSPGRTAALRYSAVLVAAPAPHPPAQLEATRRAREATRSPEKCAPTHRYTAPPYLKLPAV